MRMNRKAIRWMAMSLAGVAVMACAVATFGKRPPRALVSQPGDYITGVIAEFRRAKSIGEGFHRAKHVTGMFWNCFEIRMVEGRVQSGLFRYKPPGNADVNAPNGPDIDF